MPSPRKSASSPVETEAKILVPSFAGIKRGILAAGGRLLTVRTLETNTLYDTPDGALRASGQSFRVRRYGVAGTVTLKGVAFEAAGLKSRVELETEVGSPEILGDILSSVGFTPQFRYEKFREVWRVGRALICLDETPLARFVEIEGTAAEIHRVAARIGLGADRFMSASYPSLWFGAGRSGDMVFAKKGKRAAATPTRKGKGRGVR